MNNGSFELSYSYTYYRNGNKKTYTGPKDVSRQYSYNADNRLETIFIPGEGYITYSAYEWDRPRTVTYPGGITGEYAYDPLMRTESIDIYGPEKAGIMSHSYGYDRMGNLAEKTTQNGSYVYTYDDLYRLTNVHNSIAGDETYAYDPSGNRLSASGVSGNWDYNQNDQLTGFENASFEYDANGNMTRKTVGPLTLNFVYDFENRLTRVKDESGNPVADYYYDPFGRRLWKEASGVRTCFVSSDEGLAGEYDATGSELRAYGYRPERPWPAGPAFMKNGERYFYYQCDGLGNPAKLTEANGTIAWSGTSDAFGKTGVDASSRIINNFRLSGRYYDSETGLHYDGSRYYDPEIGRYLQPDAAGFRTGVNPYTLRNEKMWHSRLGCVGGPSAVETPVGER